MAKLPRRILLEKFRRIDRLLDESTLLGYNVEIVSGELINRMCISLDGEEIAIYVNLLGFTPDCLIVAH